MKRDSLVLGRLPFFSFKTRLSNPFIFSEVHYQMVTKFYKMAQHKCKMLISKKDLNTIKWCTILVLWYEFLFSFNLFYSNIHKTSLWKTNMPKNLNPKNSSCAASTDTCFSTFNRKHVSFEVLFYFPFIW